MIKQRLSDWLSQKAKRPIRIETITSSETNGFSAKTLLVGATNGTDSLGYAVRFQNPDGQSLFMEANVGFQFDVIRAVHASGAVPVPRPVGLELDGSLLGAPFMVTMRVNGIAPSQSPNFNLAGWVTAVPPEQRAKMWCNAIRAMADLHNWPWRNGFAFLDRPDMGATGLHQMLESTKRWYSWSKRLHPHPLVEAALGRLTREMPDDAANCILWGDASITNMLFDGTRVTALLDWEVASLGPAELDLAWWLFFQDYLSRGFGHRLLEGVPGRSETMAIYEESRGLPLRNFEYYELLARTRNAIMSMRSVNRQIEQARLPENTRAITDNPVSRLLAEQMNVEPAPIGEDYAAYLTAVSQFRA